MRERTSFEICAVPRGNADLFGSLISPVNFREANHSNGVCGVSQASHPLSITSMAELRVPDVRGNWTCTEHVWNSCRKFGVSFGIPAPNNRLLPTRSRDPEPFGAKNMRFSVIQPQSKVDSFPAQINTHLLTITVTSGTAPGETIESPCWNM